MASAGKIATGAASGAAMGTAIMPGWGTAIGAVGGGLLAAFGGGDNEAPQAPAAQFGNNPLTNQLAAQQYAAGLQQQQAQNAREAALYGNANGNFDIANAAQLRGGPQISSTLADKQAQLAALGGTNAAVGNVNQAGQQLTALGSRPMGDSYAEAQLRQGQDAAMAQQLSMARSGRSLGSGQAAMQQAAFNNAALNQQTNQAAAVARIQEQNAYNQFQAGALGAAGQQYGAAGALSGQAGNQATGIRQGNEAVQAQNAALTQSQQGINNQTSGIYNQLGAQQQQLGMQSNQLGQNAFQFGAGQALGMQQGQLNANVGQTSATTATNIANQQNANQHDAATANAIATGAGAIASMTGGGGTTAAPVNPNNPSGSTPVASPYQNITTASNTAGVNNGSANRPGVSSDERQKTNIKPLTSGSFTAAAPPDNRARPAPLPAPPQLAPANNPNKYSGFSPEDEAVYRAADAAAAAGRDTYTANGVTQPLYPHGKDTPMDSGTALMPSYGEAGGAPSGPAPVSYAETIAALNSGYRASQFAPTDVLNHVAGAGAGPSASQSAVIARMTGKDAPPAPAAPAPNARAIAAAGADTFARMSTPGPILTRAALDAAKPAANGRFLGTPAVGAPGYARGIDDSGLTARLMSSQPAPAAPAAPAAWGDVFNAPTLDPRIQAYLNGASPYPPPAPAAPTTPGSKMPNEYRGSEGGGNAGYIGDDSYNLNRLAGERSSDVHSKTRIHQLESQLAALQGPPTASFVPQQPDTAALDSAYRRQGGEPMGERYPSPRQPDTGALDAAYAREQNAPAIDLRPAQGYSYEYKDPRAPGAAPGRHVGPMAQDLEHTAAAGTVRDTPHGKVVDTEGLTMVNTAALSELQRKMQLLEAMGGGQPAAPAYQAGLYPQTRSPY